MACLALSRKEDMAKTYTKLDGWFWWNHNFQQLGAAAKLVYLFLRTHPHLSMIGSLRTTLASMISEMGEKEALFMHGFEDLVKAGLVRFDLASRFLTVSGYVLMEENRPANQNVVKAWIKEFSQSPDSSLSGDLAAEIHQAIALLPRNFKDGLDLNSLETVRKRFRNRSETVLEPVTVSVAVTAAVAIAETNKPLSKDEKLLSTSSEEEKNKNSIADAWEDPPF